MIFTQFLVDAKQSQRRKVIIENGKYLLKRNLNISWIIALKNIGVKKRQKAADILHQSNP